MAWALGTAAVLAWLGALYQLRAFLRRGRSSLVAHYWLALLFISLALTFVLPPVYTTVNAVVGVPNLSKLLANVSAVLAVLSAQNVVYVTLVSGHTAARLRTASFTAAGVVLVVMTAFFFGSGPVPETLAFWTYYEVGTLAVYRFTYLGYMAVAAATVTGLWARYAVSSEGMHLKASFGLMAAGGVVGLGYLANDAGAVFAALGLHPFPWWGDSRLTDLLIALAITLVVVGAMMPVWGRIMQGMRAHLAFLRLRRLWLELRKACPPVALLPDRPLWRDLLDPRDATFRLHRQVVEIRDASFAVSASAHPYARSIAREVGERLRLDPDERTALEEAARLRTGIEARRRGSPGPTRVMGAAPEDVSRDSPSGGFAQEVGHLTRVARHAAGTPAMRLVLERLTEGAEAPVATTLNTSDPEVQGNHG